MSAHVWTIDWYRPRLACGFEIAATDPDGGNHVETIADFIGHVEERAWAAEDEDLAHIQVLHAHWRARTTGQAAVIALGEPNTFTGKAGRG